MLIFRYNIDPQLWGFGKILPSAMIFPSGQYDNYRPGQYDNYRPGARGIRQKITIIAEGNILPNPQSGGRRVYKLYRFVRHIYLWSKILTVLGVTIARKVLP